MEKYLPIQLKETAEPLIPKKGRIRAVALAVLLAAGLNWALDSKDTKEFRTNLATKLEQISQKPYQISKDGKTVQYEGQNYALVNDVVEPGKGYIHVLRKNQKDFNLELDYALLDLTERINGKKTHQLRPYEPIKVVKYQN